MYKFNPEGIKINHINYKGWTQKYDFFTLPQIKRNMLESVCVCGNRYIPVTIERNSNFILKEIFVIRSLFNLYSKGNKFSSAALVGLSESKTSTFNKITLKKIYKLLFIYMYVVSAINHKGCHLFDQLRTKRIEQIPVPSKPYRCNNNMHKSLFISLSLYNGIS